MTPSPAQPADKHRTPRPYLAPGVESWPMDEWRRAVECALEDARRGDAAARDWLSRYVLPPRDDCS